MEELKKSVNYLYKMMTNKDNKKIYYNKLWIML